MSVSAQAELFFNMWKTSGAKLSVICSHSDGVIFLTARLLEQSSASALLLTVDAAPGGRGPMFVSLGRASVEVEPDDDSTVTVSFPSGLLFEISELEETPMVG